MPCHAMLCYLVLDFTHETIAPTEKEEPLLSPLQTLPTMYVHAFPAQFWFSNLNNENSWNLPFSIPPSFLLLDEYKIARG
jgi:hypothetical protein